MNLAAYFADAPQPLFTVNSPSKEAAEVARGCFRHLQHVFEELEQIRAFELLRTSKDRANYLLTKEAKIVAMTTMHAALKVRRHMEGENMANGMDRDASLFLSDSNTIR